MTPTESILAAAGAMTTVRDATGRTIMIRRLTALDTLRLFKAAGPALAMNQPWLSMAILAMSVTEIDGVPVPVPVSEAQIESLVDRLGEAGMDAIADATAETAEPTESSAGN